MVTEVPVSVETSGWGGKQELWFIIILIVFALTSLIMFCICLQRYYVYRTKSNPANQAPIEACTYFTNGSYKKMRNLPKSEKTRISDAIKQNQKVVVQRHIPPLLPEPAKKPHVFSAVQRSSRHDETKKNNKATDRCQKTTSPPKITAHHPTDASGHYFGFAELRRRCVSNYQCNDHLASREIEQAKGCGGKKSYEYRREALDYALNVDRAIIALNPGDDKLVRAATKDIRSHIKSLRTEMLPGNMTKYRYPALRTLNQDNIETIADVLHCAKYGADYFGELHLERCKNLVDEFCLLINSATQHSRH